MNKNNPLVLSGPSGSGKTFLMNYLVKNYPFKNVLSTMTRAKRPGEVHMVDNEYLTHDKFKKVEESGDFILTIEAFGEKYGYRRSFIEKIREDNLIPVAIMFTPNIELFTKTSPESHCIFLYPKSLEILEKRMKERGDKDDAIAKRLISATNEIKSYDEDVKNYYQKSYEISDNKDVYKIVNEILEYYNLKN